MVVDRIIVCDRRLQLLHVCTDWLVQARMVIMLCTTLNHLRGYTLLYMCTWQITIIPSTNQHFITFIYCSNMNNCCLLNLILPVCGDPQPFQSGIKLQWNLRQEKFLYTQFWRKDRAYCNNEYVQILFFFIHLHLE